MTILVLGVVSTCHLFGPEHPRAVSIAFGYLAIQVCLSYFLAGPGEIATTELARRNGLCRISGLALLRGSRYGAT